MLILLLSFFIEQSAGGFSRGGGVRAGRVCYPYLGCFQTDGPWSSLERPVPPPQSPQLLDIRAFFFSNSDPKEKHIVETWPIVILNKIPFDSKMMTYFIIHGYEYGYEDWTLDLKDVLLARGDANVFIGDWFRGRKPYYFQACSNSRIAAAEFVNLLKFLIKHRGLDISKLHLIGHGVGAQVCGQIGKQIQGIHRITALDAAQPLFHEVDDVVKLTKNDAVFVDAVHSDASPLIPLYGYGFMTNFAHIDYYMNAGYYQPGCGVPPARPPQHAVNLYAFVEAPINLRLDAVDCSSARSHEYWIEAVNRTDCTLWGSRASWSNMLRGIANGRSGGFFTKFLGTVCTADELKEDCSPMGLESFDHPARGAFVVNTRGFKPFCLSSQGVISQDRLMSFIHKSLHIWLRDIMKSREEGTDPGDYDFDGFDPETAL